MRYLSSFDDEELALPSSRPLLSQRIYVSASKSPSRHYQPSLRSQTHPHQVVQSPPFHLFTIKDRPSPLSSSIQKPHVNNYGRPSRPITDRPTLVRRNLDQRSHDAGDLLRRPATTPLTWPDHLSHIYGTFTLGSVLQRARLECHLPYVIHISFKWTSTVCTCAFFWRAPTCPSCIAWRLYRQIRWRQ